MTHIEQNIATNDSEIPPSPAVLNVELTPEELVGRPRGAEAAPAWRLGIQEIPACARNVALHVVATGSGVRRVKGNVFNLGTGDFLMPNSCDTRGVSYWHVWNVLYGGVHAP